LQLAPDNRGRSTGRHLGPSIKVGVSEKIVVASQPQDQATG
jgi:hypothetical protein